MSFIINIGGNNLKATPNHKAAKKHKEVEIVISVPLISVATVPL